LSPHNPTSDSEHRLVQVPERVVGRGFRNANQVTVLGRPISIVVIAER